MGSRGDAVSSYLPGFGEASGVKIYKSNLRAQTLSGTIISAGVTYAVNHQLGKVPSVVIITPSFTLAQAASAGHNVALVDRASATTSAKFYIAGNQDGLKYRAFLLV